MLLYVLDRHLYLATRLAGLLFYKPADGKWTFQAVASIIYYIVLLLVTWANVVRYCWAYIPDEQFQPLLMVRVVIHIVYVHAAVTYTGTVC